MHDIPFFKGEALGNDYLVVDAADLDDAGSVAPALRDLAVRLCDRHRGAGADGLLVADLDARPVRLRIINPDGTGAEKSGNGLRIFAAYLDHRALVARDEWFDVALPRDTVAMRVEEDLDDGAVLVRVRMGPADFSGAAVAFAPEPGDTQGVELDLGDAGSAEINTVSLGNPHCVVYVDALDRADFVARAPRLCTHEAFAEGTNVQFARATGPHELELWIWERGAGETLASGSSACAAAAVGVRRGLLEPGPIIASMPGGSVEVDVSVSDDGGYSVELLGPARMVYRARTV
jgi:diaminopimelate epimerase